ncbi:MAG: tetratricopeptide repeat protein [Candidatus Hodarchaeales archaeon]|jgi:tetratricopeptide (TPR) repeat protein
MNSTEGMKKIEELIEDNNYHKALQMVDKLLLMDLAYDELVTCQFQKCKIYLKIGDPDRVLDIVRDMIPEINARGSNQQLIDANIMKSRALKLIGKFPESLEAVEEGLRLFNGIDPSQRFFMLDKQASLLYQLGTVQRLQGDFDVSLESMHKCLALREKLSNKKDIIRVLYYLGVLYREKWDLDKGLDFTRRSLVLAEELDLKDSIAFCYWNIGNIYYYKFDLDQALEITLKALVLFKELDDKNQIAIVTGMIGEIYKEKGEMELAHEYLQESLAAFEEQDLFGLGYAIVTSILGEVFVASGKDELAFEFFEKSILMYGFFGSRHQYITRALALIIKLGFDTNNVDRVTPQIELLKQLNEETDSPLVDHVNRVVQAMILRASNRYRDKTQAQVILQQLLVEEKVYHMVERYTLVLLCDILMEEFRTMGDEEILNEIKNAINKLMTKTKLTSSYSLLAEIYLLQSKLALLELDLDKTRHLLKQAKLMADEKGLSRLSMIISLEQESLLSQMTKWESIIAQKPSQKEMLELTQFEELLDRMLHNRLYRKEEEISDYAARARALIEKWERY